MGQRLSALCDTEMGDKSCFQSAAIDESWWCYVSQQKFTANICRKINVHSKYGFTFEVYL